jgi:N-methylhydantoinase A
VTDADLVLGRLDPMNFAGGTIPLHPDRSVAALQEHLGERLDMDAAEAGWGLSEVVDENMANAARVHAVENGEDLSDYTMIAFGGAAPLHASRLCEKLGVTRLLVPPGAGVGSAIGFLKAPFSFEANRSRFTRIGQFDPATVTEIFAALEAEARAFVRTCDADAPIRAEHRAYMRYSGQGWEIPVALTQGQAAAPSARTFVALFEAEYAKLFGRSVEGMDVEVTVWSVNAFTPSAPVTKVTQLAAGAMAAANVRRVLFDPAVGRSVKAGVYARADLEAGARIVGPALITETETTVVVSSSRVATILSDGCIELLDKDAYDG